MTQDEYAEIDLAALSDDELTEQMHNDLYDGMAAEIVEGTNILLGRGWTATKVLDDALVAGMKIVGIDFRDGILFVPEVLLAANAMKAGMAILRPLLAETGAEPVGKVVIGTVKGDIHDIGKNLVGMMLEGAGFEVVDLGINTDADKFIAALELHKPDILGHVGAADDDDAVHEGRHPDAQGPRHPRRLHRPGRRRAAQRGVRRGRRRRRLLPRRRRGRRDRPPAHRRAPRQCRLRPDDRRPPTRPTRLVIVGCGALARELARADRGHARRRRRRASPPALHIRPERIADAVAAKVEKVRARHGRDVRIFVAYADCGTGGPLDASSPREGVERHRAARTATSSMPARRPSPRCQDEELGDVLPDRLPGPPVRPLIIAGLGLDRHPELLPTYFGNYRRLVYLAQTDDPELTARAPRPRPTASASPSSAARPATASSPPSIQHAVAGAA